MFRCLLAYLGVALSLSICPVSAQTGLPYDSDYEAAEGFVAGAALSAAPWAAGTSGAVISSTDFASDAQSVLLPDGSAGFLSASFSGAQSGGIVFVDFYLKPAAGVFEDLPVEATDLSSALTGLVDDAGTGWLYVVHGDGQGGGAWQRVNTEIPLTSGVATNWVRFTYRLNYSTKTWDLYLDDKLVATDLRFLDDVLTQFTEFRLKGGGLAPVYFDFFYAGYDNPVYVDTDKDGISDAYETANFLNNLADDRNGDADFDGVSNILEFMRDMEAGNPDTDGDGVHDGWELSFGADPLTADPYALSVVPFTDSFEGHPATGLTSANGWLFQGRDEPEVSADAAVTGAQSAKITGNDTENVQLYNLFSSQSGSVVWVDLNVKPGSIDTEPALGAMTSAGFYFGPDGLLRVFDGSELPTGAWKVLDHRPVDTSDWQRLTIRLNYPVQRFSLYLDGKRVAHNYGFANPVPYFQSFSLIEGSSAGASYLDDVTVAYLEPGSLDNDGDGLLNSEEDINLDGIVDAGETDPESTDTDVDGVGDWVEGLFGLSPTVAETYALPAVQPDGSLLWEHGFESSEGFALGTIDSQLGWNGSGTSTVTDSEAAEGTQSLSVTAADSTAFTFSGWDGVSEVWVSFRAKLLPGALPETSSFQGPVSAVFGLSQSSRLAALDTNAGEWLITHNAVEEGWQDYAIFLNYRDKTWDLLLNGVIQFSDIGFTDPRLPHFARFQVRNDSEVEIDGESLIDAVAISNAEPAGLDFDGDGLDNALERSLGSNVLLADSDGDQMPDAWEYQYGFLLTEKDATGDLDNDGLDNLGEYQYGFDPTVADTAGVVGFVNCDVYNGINGSAVSGLTNSSKFPLQPDVRTLLAELTTDYSTAGSSNYGQRIRGLIIAPVTEDYTFWISGDDKAELWLSTDATAFNKERIAYFTGYTNYKQWTKYGSQRSIPVSLIAGQEYYFEVLHKESGGKDHVSVAWQYPGQNIQVVPGQHLKTVTPNANDLDEDGLPDDWEIAIGLDPAKGYGINGFAGDADGDGLANYEERAYGIDPLLTDSDGDGYDDYIEVKELMTDPAVAEAVDWTLAETIDGSNAIVDFGIWEVDGASVVGSGSGGGQISLHTILPASSMYQLTCDFTRTIETSSSRNQAVVFLWYIDGEYIGKTETSSETDISSYTALKRTPFLTAGAHTISLRWINVYRGQEIAIDSLNIEQPTATIPEVVESWLDNEIAQVASLTVAPGSSLTSPVCIEGLGKHLSGISLSPSASVKRAGLGQWYANVPLIASDATAITVSLQNGGRVETLSVDWTASNVFELETLDIREGDSLKLSATPTGESDGTFEISVDGQSIGSDLSDFIVKTFDSAGSFVVSGTYTTSLGVVSVASLTVNVVTVPQPTEVPALWAGKIRSWTWAGIPDQVVVKADDGMLLSLDSTSGQNRIFSLRRDEAYEDISIVARLGEGGSILTSVPTEAFWLRAAVDGFLPAIMLDETTMEVGNDIFVYGLPDSVEVKIDVFKAGVVLDDGTRTRFITRTDFDELGRYPFKMLKPVSVGGGPCHRIMTYQSGQHIGTK